VIFNQFGPFSGLHNDHTHTSSRVEILSLFKNQVDMKINVKSLLLIAFFFASCFTLRSQELNKQFTDPKDNEVMLVGYCNREGLEEGEFGKVFDEYYSIYEPDKEVISQMRGKTDSVAIVIVMGTWCSDSQEQVPRFFKILDKIRFDDKDVTIICVDKNKEAGEIDLKKYDIQKVPTFIVYRKTRDAGRIVEKPMSTLEKDLLMLLED
jgi:hypothetical protein